MEPVPLGNDFADRQINELVSLFEGPAYIRRARGVEEALEHLLGLANRQRDEWLAMPRLHLGQLHALAGEWAAIRPWLADDSQLDVLEHLRRTLAPQLRVPPDRTRSTRVLRRTLRELTASLVRFNARWEKYLRTIDVRPINDLRDGYNRYYVLEKACALRSEVLARLGFTPLLPLDLEELQRRLPLLPVPRLTV